MKALIVHMNGGGISSRFDDDILSLPIFGTLTARVTVGIRCSLNELSVLLLMQKCKIEAAHCMCC